MENNMIVDIGDTSVGDERSMVIGIENRHLFKIYPILEKLYDPSLVTEYKSET